MFPISDANIPNESLVELGKKSSEIPLVTHLGNDKDKAGYLQAYRAVLQYDSHAFDT